MPLTATSALRAALWVASLTLLGACTSPAPPAPPVRPAPGPVAPTPDSPPPAPPVLVDQSVRLRGVLEDLPADVVRTTVFVGHASVEVARGASFDLAAPAGGLTEDLGSFVAADAPNCTGTLDVTRDARVATVALPGVIAYTSDAALPMGAAFYSPHRWFDLTRTVGVWMWSDRDAVVVGERDCAGGAQAVMHQSLSLHLKRGWNEVQWTRTLAVSGHVVDDAWRDGLPAAGVWRFLPGPL